MPGAVPSAMTASKAKSSHSPDELHALAEKHLAQEQHHDSQRSNWSPLREFLYSVIHTHCFDGSCTAIILFNMVLVIIDTNAAAAEEEPPYWAVVVTHIFLAWYTVELATKLYIYRQAFFRDRWNNMDFGIVGMDLVLLAVGLIVADMPSVAILRVFRLARLARAFKAASFFHELHSLLRSFTCAIKAILWGMLLIFLCLIVWGILAVQLIHPVNVQAVKSKPHIYDECERCPRAFSTVGNSMLTLFQQLVAQDAWAEVSAVIIEEAPWTCLFMLLVLMTVGLTMLNLILTVTLEAGASAAAEDDNENAIQMRKNVLKAEKKLINICASLDTDHSGALNIREFLGGFESNKEFQDALQVMNVNSDDIQMIFNICDEDGSGDVNYHEFVDQLRRIKDSGEKMLLYYVTDIRHMVTTMKRRQFDRVLNLDHADSGQILEEQSVSECSKGDPAQAKDRSLESAPNGKGGVGGIADDKTGLPVVMEEAVEAKVIFQNGSDTSIKDKDKDKDAVCLAINELQQQLMNIMQEIPTKMDAILTANTQGERISEMSDNLSTIVQRVEAHSGLLNKLVDEAGALRVSTNATRGCLPVFPFRSGLSGAGPPTIGSSRINSDGSCCDGGGRRV